MAWKWKLHIISIHAPTRGATPYGLLTANVRLFQSTLLQEERRCSLDPGEGNMCISIHAPTRGATAGFFSSDRTIAHFNPRSYKRSDPVPPAVSALPCYFNPRSYKRSDKNIYAQYYDVPYFNPRSYKRSDSIRKDIDTKSFISIHAPTRGATTGSHDKNGKLIFISIHAPTRGAT